MSYIVVKNSSSVIVETSLGQLANLYVESGFVNSILVNRINSKDFLIEFPGKPDFERFAYFVNFLRYPEGYDNYEPLVYGVWHIEEPIEKIEGKTGDILLVYVSKYDDQFDNVSVANSNGKVYLYSFTGKIIEEDKIELRYSEFIDKPNNAEFYIEIKPGTVAKEMEVKPWWKFW